MHRIGTAALLVRASGMHSSLGPVLDAALDFGRHCNFDELHGRRVARNALRLFDGLRGLHGLGERERGMLLAAALLHDVGRCVSRRRHHRHSEQLLLRSRLACFSPAELRLVAAVTRYHRKRDPSPRHRGLAWARPAARERIVTLACLLRIADALEREDGAEPRSLQATVTAQRVVLRVDGADRRLLRRAEQRAAPLFARAFLRRLRLRTLRPALAAG